MSSSIFEGLKVADFTSNLAAPLVARFLGEAGATVVKVECHKYPDALRTFEPKDGTPGVDRSVQFAFYFFGKYSISLDMDKPPSREIGKKMVKWADIVVECMVPGAMARWGLDYESCRQVKPDIIYLSSLSLGRSGPLSSYAAMGYHHTPLAGVSNLTGWPDRSACADSLA